MPRDTRYECPFLRSRVSDSPFPPEEVPDTSTEREKVCAMSVSQHDWSLHRKGQIDQERHKEKIREAIKKNLSDIVSEENIILSDGKKMVQVPIRSLEEYRFRYDPGRQQHAGQGTGKSKVGDVVAQEPRPGKGKNGDAGKEAGYDYYEAEITDGRTGGDDLRGSQPAQSRTETPAGDGNRGRTLYRCTQKGTAWPTSTRSARSWRT